MSSEISTPKPTRLSLREGVAIAALLASLGGVGMAFAWPWLPRSAPGAASLASFAPVEDGRAALYVKYGPDGKPVSWESQNQQVLRPGRALAGELRKAQSDAVEKLFLRPGEKEISDRELLRRLGGATLVRLTSRELKPGGDLSTSVSLLLRDGRGEYLVGFYDAANDRDLVFEPALLSLPAEVKPGRSWESRGKLAGMVDYTFTGRVLEAAPFREQDREMEDCRRVETRFVLANAGATLNDEQWSGWYCAGVGLVSEQARDAAGKPTHRRVALAAEGLPSALAAALPAVQAAAPAAAEGAPRGPWHLSRVARIGQMVNSSESTILPVWIPGAPPAVLVAGQGSDLTAYDAADPTGRVLWRFHPGGTVYSPPAYDAATGRIFFGASDKRLYALDARGLFLWSFRTGDNVATRPAVVNGVVVFGSEDRTIYGVDAATGRLRWKHGSGGPVVSSPAAVGGLVAIGSDDGTVYGIDAASGRVRWTHETDDAVEAPVVAEGGTLYVAGRDKKLRALDPRTGEARWTGTVGNVVRSAPAVGPAAVYVVDAYGYVKAFDRASGRRLWSTSTEGYSGPVAVADGALFVARGDGTVHRLSLQGKKVAEWSTPGAKEGKGPSFHLGATAAAGAVWLADHSAGVWRLGAPTGGALPLPLAWMREASAKPFSLNLLTSTPVEHEGRAFLLDRENHLYEVDPASGAAVLRGRLADTVRSALAEPVTAGSTLLVPVGNTLHAARLPDGRALWSHRGEGLALHPAAVAGGTVLWTAQREGGTQGSEGGTLYAVDAATGRLRWSHRIEGVAAVGRAVVRGNTVFLGTPATALDLATGRVLWKAPAREAALGGPALSARGDVLFAAALGRESGTGSVTAHRASDGRPLWRADLGRDETLHLMDRLRVDGEVVVVPSLSGRVLALDAATGRERWRYTPDAPRLGTVTVDGGRVYLALQNGQVVVLDAATGRVAARFTDLEQSLSAYGYAQRPVRVGGRLIVPTGISLLAFDLPRE